MSQPPPRRTTAGAFAVSFVLVEVVRVLLPQVLLVLPEDHGLTLGAALAAAASVLVAAPIAAGFLASRWPRGTWIASALLLAVARAALLLDLPVTTSAVVAGLGVAAGTSAVVALAAGSPSGRAARVGILLGIGTEAIVRASSAGAGLLWSTTVIATLATLVLLGAVVVLALTTGRMFLAPLADTGPPAWPWWWLLPALVLTGTLTTPSGRLAVATGWTPGQVAAMAAAVQGAAVLAALLAPRLAPTRAAVLGATSILVGATAALPASGWTGVLGPLLTAVGLGAIAGLLAGAGRPSTTRHRAQVAGAAAAASGLLLLLYASWPDLGIPGNRRILLLLAALVAVGLTAVAARQAGYVTLRSQLRPTAVAAVILVAVGTAAVATWSASNLASPSANPPDQRLTIATFNVRSGFGTDGRFAPDLQALLLAERSVDVVLLNGVDRGSWSRGGQDVLARLSADLGLDHVAFVPAASEVQGHALLSRYPIRELASSTLPSERRRDPQTQLAAILELDQDRDLGVVGTQLLPGGEAEEVRLAQARALAGTVARLRERGLPTVVLGDLGTREGAATLDVFDALVTTALPEGSTTYPSWDPMHQRDYVLLSPELRRSTIQTPETTTSSHLPVIVTVEFRAPGL